jgi:hypothetical protein
MMDGTGRKLWYYFTIIDCPVGMASAQKATQDLV